MEKKIKNAARWAQRNAITAEPADDHINIIADRDTYAENSLTIKTAKLYAVRSGLKFAMSEDGKFLTLSLRSSA